MIWKWGRVSRMPTDTRFHCIRNRALATISHPRS